MIRILSLALALLAGQAQAQPLREFSTGFEDVSDFDGFYLTPQNYKGTSSQELSTEQVRSGRFAHKGWIYGANRRSTLFTNNNHRGYPTIQLYKLEGGAFRTPVKIEFWVWLDMEIKPGEWFSFATLDYTTRDTWDPVLVNLSDEGIVHLMHVPRNGKAEYSFQTEDIIFPMREWVKLGIELHFDEENGYAKVWQNDQLVSQAPVGNGDGLFTQAHFGLYAPPSMTEGVVFNDDLVIREIRGTEEY